MIEIIIGLMCLAAGAGLSLGIGAGYLGLGGLENVTGTALLTCGALLSAHGLYRTVRDRKETGQHGLRTRALMLTSLTGATIIITLGIGLLSQLTISGLPIGFHIASEGVPLALFVLFLIYNRKQASIDRDAMNSRAGDAGEHYGV